MAERKVNFIFIQCDSLDGRILTHPLMSKVTVHLQKLAEKGVLFQNAYATSFMCVPSRASMWSGLYVHHCQSWNNYKGLEPETPTFLTPFASSNYQTVTFGKTDYLSGRHSLRARVSAWTRSASIRRPNYRMLFPQILLTENPRVHPGDWENMEKALAWLSKENLDSPFFLYLGLNLPHPPFVTSTYYQKKVPQEEIGVPPFDTADHPVLKYQKICKNWQYGFSPEVVKLVQSVYLGMVAEVDAIIGFFLQTLKKLSLLDRTFLVFTSDHGELALEHQQYYKMSPHEGSSRVPLIFSGPGIPEGKVICQPISLIDIFPTLLELAGLPAVTDLDGHSLVPFFLDGQQEERPVLAEFHDSSVCTGCFMLRKGDYKYIVYPGYPCQLFNLRQDPGELRNLAGEKSEIVKEMDADLRSLVDYEKVDCQAKDYDRESFSAWRKEQLTAGTYFQNMARIFSGWDYLKGEDILPWTEEDEERIKSWLKGKLDYGTPQSGKQGS